MSWWNPASWGQGGQDPNDVRNQQRGMLNQAAGASGNFANLAQGNYDTATSQLGGTYGQLGDAMKYLQGQMQGQNSVSAEQLRQGLQQNMAGQRSMAASAAPQNAAMAARTAAIQMGRLGAGMSGQAAMAGLQERNQAAQNYGQLGSALGQLQLGARGQDVNAALGSQQNAIQGYGQVLNGPQNQGWLERNMNWLKALGGGIQGSGNGGGGAAGTAAKAAAGA
jgi:hypothetical protein